MYDTTDRWREYLDGTNAALLAEADALAAEAGEPVEAFRAGVVEMARTAETMTRRILAVATVPGP